MTRIAHLESHFTPEQLKSRYLFSEDRVESRRWHLIWLVSKKWTIKKAAKAIGINYDYAKELVRRYNTHGEQGVANGRKSPKKRPSNALLNEIGIEQLEVALSGAPEDKGLWTGPKVARWIEKKTGKKKVWNQRGWDYLKKCRYSPQRPRRKHRKGNKKEQEQFKQKLPERVKELQQKHPDATIEVWAFDEHRVGLKPIIRRIWAPIGERPIAEVEHRYEWLYLYSFVHPKTGETEWYLIPRVNVQWFNLVLKAIASATGAGKDKIVLIVVDRAGWHMSQKVEVPEGIYLEPLPPYSPELQPAERLWVLADEPLANKSFESLDQLEEILAQRCRILANMQAEIQAVTNYYWWPDPEHLESG